MRGPLPPHRPEEPGAVAPARGYQQHHARDRTPPLRSRPTAGGMSKDHVATLLRGEPHHAGRTGQTLPRLGARANDCPGYPQPDAPLMTPEGTDQQDRDDM